MNWNMTAANLCFGVGTIVAELACRHFGMEWNQGNGYHMMYWIPLEIWGWIYTILGGPFVILAVVGGFRS